MWVFLISKRWSIQIRRKRRMRVEAYLVEAFNLLGLCLQNPGTSINPNFSSGICRNPKHQIRLCPSVVNHRNAPNARIIMRDIWLLLLGINMLQGLLLICCQYYLHCHQLYSYKSTCKDIAIGFGV